MDEAMLKLALADLIDGPRHSIARALELVPNTPGLYAIYGDAGAIDALGVGTVTRPLYVGKAERSLLGRDMRTHFATGKTGSSTVRRTVAALLRDQLELRAVPRNLAKPDRSANYALDAEGDARLTSWMHRHLSLAFWTRPDDVVLDELETAALEALRPPLTWPRWVRPATRG